MLTWGGNYVLVYDNVISYYAVGKMILGRGVATLANPPPLDMLLNQILDLIIRYLISDSLKITCISTKSQTKNSSNLSKFTLHEVVNCMYVHTVELSITATLGERRYGRYTRVAVAEGFWLTPLESSSGQSVRIYKVIACFNGTRIRIYSWSGQ